ncbi:MAG: acyl-CoA dehydratase activase [Nitrospirota bacterium]
MQNDFFLGIDIGSITVKTVLIDSHGSLFYEMYTRINGSPLPALERELAALERVVPKARIKAAAITGIGGKQVAEIIGATFLNEILSQAAFAERFYPDARTIIEMGGEDAKLILLEKDHTLSGIRIKDFCMNTACAAGTGSFLDQQASRLQLSIEEFSTLALKSKNPPRIAGRCSVFAKSDMIHLQQTATPHYDIVAGLCHAMARNFKATIGKGRKYETPALFLGGVAANLGMRRAFCTVLKLPEQHLIVPEHFHTSGAIGAALMVMKSDEKVAYQGLNLLSNLLQKKKNRYFSGMAPLSCPSGIFANPDKDATGFDKNEPEDAYLGIDVGSVSTNIVVIDRHLRVLSKRYLPTAGQPIEAVKQGLSEVGEEIGPSIRIRGAGTTGSGRYLTGDMVGADVIRNEITAQATAATAIDPSVDTIFEIGGQDSKFISLQEGAVIDFEMNKACAAGTGSFLEEQAERLGISIKKEFEDRAFQAASPCRFGERCTVFIESDMVHSMNNGASVEELSAGLAYSIVYNYLNKVVSGRRVGDRIFFQGGVAANKAVVSAFEAITKKSITVPPHHEVTGAIGAAILAMQENPVKSSFKGFDLSQRTYSITTFECAECSNRCDIRQVRFDGEKPLFYGSRCEKYDVKKGLELHKKSEDLFSFRETLLSSCSLDAVPGMKTIGIPRMLYLNEFLPFWQTFFRTLGYQVVLSDKTNRTLISRTLESIVAETCFPAKVALGHIQDILDKQVDILFLPSFVRFPSFGKKQGHAQACPYAQALPYIAKASMRFEKTKTIEPILYLQDERHFNKSMLALGSLLEKGRREIRKAQQRALEAQMNFFSAMEKKGEEVLAGLKQGEKALVLIGRSYNTCDSGINLNLPSKIRDLGVQAIPMEALPLRDVNLSGHENMYWRSGQAILAAARFIKQHPNLYPLYLTNFGCGPDSFITHFFEQEIGEKPYLQLEIDEHSADAGAITRIEAFLDSISKTRSMNTIKKTTFNIVRTGNGFLGNKKVLFPRMTDHAFALAAAFRSCNVNAEVLPESDDETVRIGREFCSGRECYPLTLTTGDMIKAVRDPEFDPTTTAFFMPSGKGPCRFGQYHRYHRQVLDRIGCHTVDIISPVQDELLHDQIQIFDRNFFLMSWRGAYAVDMLQKALWEHRPYEKQHGKTDQIYTAALKRITKAVERRADLLPLLRDAYEDFSGIAMHERKKPVIGIVGEIYIRSNRFSNENIVRQIEMLGGETWIAPISEWLLYLNATAKVSARMNRSWKALLKAHVTSHVQHRDERRFLSGFNGSMRSLHEPSIDQTFRTALPYIHHSFEGEAVLTVGKAIDYIRRGVSGIINVMPLTCMPGTIASAVLKRVQEDYNGIPVLNISYEGQGDSQTLTRLEAFMHQAKSCHHAVKNTV